MVTAQTVFFLSVLTVQTIFVVLTFITKDTLFVKTFGKERIPFGTLAICLLAGPVLKRFRTRTDHRGAAAMYLTFRGTFVGLGLFVLGVRPLVGTIVSFGIVGCISDVGGRIAGLDSPDRSLIGNGSVPFRRSTWMAFPLGFRLLPCRRSTVQ